ncbi:MAG: DUF2490 domain-containing protein [Bacteroidota bacterium]
MNKIFTLLLFSFLSISLLAQQSQGEDELGNWIMYFGMNRIHDQWSIHTEVQYRNHTVAPVNIEQLLLRTGLNYHLSSSAFVTAGYAYIASHDYESEQSEPESTEHRIWQQLIMTNKVGRIKFEHRYRIEQRWVNNDYRNRLRYRLMAFLPLNKPNIEPGALFLGVYDEIFMNTQQTFFDRNRLYGAVGYQINKPVQVQVGLLHQRVNAFGKYYLQFAVVYNPDFSVSTD